jgi:hypothetical protein
MDGAHAATRSCAGNPLINASPRPAVRLPQLLDDSNDDGRFESVGLADETKSSCINETRRRERGARARVPWDGISNRACVRTCMRE